MLSIKERLDKHDEIEMLELEVRELEARLKLWRLKAELENDPAEERKAFVDGLVKGNDQNARISELESTIEELRQEYTAMQHMLADVDKERTKWMQKTFDAERALKSVNEKEGVVETDQLIDRLERLEDELCERLGVDHIDEKEMARMRKEFRAGLAAQSE